MPPYALQVVVSCARSWLVQQIVDGGKTLDRGVASNRSATLSGVVGAGGGSVSPARRRTQNRLSWPPPTGVRESAAPAADPRRDSHEERRLPATARSSRRMSGNCPAPSAPRLVSARRRFGCCDRR